MEEKNDNQKKENGTKEKAEKTSETELQELKDSLVRLAAEFDNYKKSVSKQIENEKNFQIAKILADIVKILDELELAIKGLGDEDRKGVGMIYTNLKESLRLHGLREIETKGKYDPRYHEVATVIESDKDDGEIVDVIRKGYMFNNVLVRPASVIISKKKA
ncbi:MAG: nucleotide exchange factor GrpE [Candidatus Micrarchaeaceae archaeon]